MHWFERAASGSKSEEKALQEAEEEASAFPGANLAAYELLAGEFRVQGSEVFCLGYFRV